MDRRTNRWKDGQMDGLLDGQTKRRPDGWTNGQTDGRTNGQTDGRTDKLIWSWGRRSMAVAREVTQHGQAQPYSWSITIVSLRLKESEE
jgi:hypothetical protein